MTNMEWFKPMVDKLNREREYRKLYKLYQFEKRQEIYDERLEQGLYLTIIDWFLNKISGWIK